jgi:hypothetical protein
MKVINNLSAEHSSQELPSSSELRKFQRAVLFVKSKAQGIEIGDELARYIEQDYVQQRKVQPNFNQEMIKLSLSITKYATLLDSGENPQPTIQLYQASKRYAVELVERNNARQPANGGVTSENGQPGKAATSSSRNQ